MISCLKVVNNLRIEIDLLLFLQQVDIYSLGIVMFEMFKPFNTQMERFHLINNLLQGNIAKDLRINRPAEVCSNEHVF